MNSKNPYKAYSQANHTVAKTRQVVMLYDGVIRNLKQAKEAMAENRIEDRFNKLVRASEIIIGLQMSLDFDQGNEAAQVLYDFYSSIDSRLIQLHRGNDEAACQGIIDDLKEMRDIWDKIDKGELTADGQVAAHSNTPMPEPAVQGTQKMLSEDISDTNADNNTDHGGFDQTVTVSA